ncbi:MAG: cupin domain-containing protein [Acidobacteria bacterium]|nr:cupin domain-containing protein [Acidobacteriota bacterium]
MKTKTLSSKTLAIAISLGAILLGITAYSAVSEGAKNPTTEGVAAFGATAQATPPPVSVRPLAPVGQFEEIHTKAQSDDWMAQIKTKGESDVHVVEVTIQPGATLGWHSHKGPSFVMVKSGTATFYDGDDPTCTPNMVTAGMSLFEPGGDVHIVRNESTTEPLVNVVIQLLPAGARRLIPEPSPGNCPF